ncbi:MAG: glycosyltransferase family 2 protein [Lachnospiraceae bacterium]
MKLLSFVVPCYNSEDYMEKCIKSLLPGGEDVEILIINDGSKDMTKEIADSYVKHYPTIIRAIHQQNAGHGGAVNTGIANATGLYLKVVDSDDWVDYSAYMEILNKLRELTRSGSNLDMMVSNFVYEKEGVKNKKVMRYINTLPQEMIFGWSDIRWFLKGQYILMHSVIYRTELLQECGLKLPEHTFYVDNLFVYQPLPSVKKIYYLDVDFYRYYIGREDQSVNENVMITRIDQQILVNKMMVDAYDLWKIPNKKLRSYMFNYLEIITVISTVMLIRGGSQEHLDKKRELWKYIKKQDIRLFHRLRTGIMGNTLHLPGKSGRRISIAAYKLSQKVIGFN